MDVLLFYFKQKTAYDVRISYWSSDVGSSDLEVARDAGLQPPENDLRVEQVPPLPRFDARAGARADADQALGRQRAHGLADDGAADAQLRSEGRRVGNECVSTCRSRWAHDH